MFERLAIKVLKNFGLYHAARDAIGVFAKPDEPDWIRVAMNRETRKLVAELHPENLDALEISGDYWGRIARFKSYRSVFFPDFDICESRTEEQFDLILAEQVFEHLLRPYRAACNIHSMLRPGGYFLVTTPFLLRIHNVPVDCSRWTELGMKHFLAECGFNPEQTRTGSWGNRACVRAAFFRWPRYLPLFHSLCNEPDFPVCVWALARK